MGMTKEDHEFMEENKANYLISVDPFEETIEQVQEQISNFHWIKLGDQQIRLFKSLENRRLIEFGEEFGEYKVRQKINNRMIKLHKRGGK